MSAIWQFIRRLLSDQASPTNDTTFEMESSQDSDGECELDSTWEDEHENKIPCKKKSRRNMRAAKDMQDFRHSCQNLDHGDDEPASGRFYNLEFYRGQIRSSPDDIHIDDFHKQWLGQYNQLENVHTYIQWLFPLQVPGVNSRAHVLTKKEIKHFRRDKQAQSKLVKSYEVMLDFYGIRLVNKDTGEVERARNWKQRFDHINRHTLNNLRITRILKCLGTLGLEHFQAPLVKFILHETLVMGELQSVKRTVLDYFMFAVLDKSKRRELVRYAYEHFRPREDFVWGPKKILQKETSKEGEQERVRTHKTMPGIKKINACLPSESMRSEKPHKNDHQKDDKAVSLDKLMAIEKKLGETKQREEGELLQKVRTRGINKIHASPRPEGIEIDKSCKNDHQKGNKKVIPNNLKENNITSVQSANEKSQCSSKNKKAEKQSQGTSVEVEINLETIILDDDLNKKTDTSDTSISANELTKENIKSDQGAQCSSKEETRCQEMSVGDEDNNDDGIEMSHGD
ncbi:opioid growth factor receptor-like protein 1 [Danio aesculapii]|uniref:opioid growth factor receptor-like protein 1 n=1 Tax=Danio aesculapii TaxID=1142201 RepID=UPI0024C0DF2E|nr:opioid growth factor receptor-like protein 1 [Danio aesculapii]